MSKIKNKLQYEWIKFNRGKNIKAVDRFNEQCHVATTDETIDKLQNSECSMCRFGDGEFKVMAGKGNGFQKKNKLLSLRLREIIVDNKHEDLIICIPNMVEDKLIRTDAANHFWNEFLSQYGKRWIGMLNVNGRYYNTQVTRLYMDYQKKELCAKWFDNIRHVWESKNILIVEGERTRLGVGNDLFSNANSIKRILGPSQNAFDKYEVILNKVKEVYNGELIVIAMGQTATVLAYDLYKNGIRALDVGHIDIEYEWFRMGVNKKVAVKGKYVKEVDDVANQVNDDKTYLSQIIYRVE